jgi:ParB/RepB/Spo0J family partition protein
MSQKPENQKSRLEIIRERATTGRLSEIGLPKTGRLVVSVERLIEDPRNERRNFTGLNELAASIRQFGIVEPLTVMPHEGDTYRIITGHRRFRAAKLAGLSSVEVIIRDAEEERVTRLKSLVSNVQRQDLNPVDLAEALQSRLDDDGSLTQRKLAKVIGKDEQWISSMLGILRMPKRLLTKLRTSQVSLPYDAVCKIARQDEDDQKQLVALLLSGATNRAIRTQINTLIGKRTKLNDQGGIGKPKQAYATSQGTTVIVQSRTDSLTRRQIVESLKEALKIAESTSKSFLDPVPHKNPSATRRKG